MVIQVLGLTECLAGFKDVSKVDMKPYIQKATQLVQRTAKQMSPNRTGFTPSGKKSKSTGYLRRSIQRDTKGKGSDAVGRVSTTTEYAIYQEFGTSKMTAQPFMFPALDAHRKDIEEGAKEYVNTNLKKFKK